MRRILITGMSGVGKSTVLDALAAHGIATVDLENEWCIAQPDGTQLWDEPAVTSLLDRTDLDPLVVAGCEPNMRVFLPRFDCVILLSAPWHALDERLATRTSNGFGRSPNERAKVRVDQEAVEPLLRAVADVEIDTRAPVDEVVREVMTAAGLA